MSCRLRFFAWFMLAACIAVAIVSRPVYAAEYQDSGYIYVSPEPEPLTVDEAILCAHDDVHVLVRGIVPFFTAIVIFVLGCVWFYRTFIKI